MAWEKRFVEKLDLQKGECELLIKKLISTLN